MKEDILGLRLDQSLQKLINFELQGQNDERRYSRPHYQFPRHTATMISVSILVFSILVNINRFFEYRSEVCLLPLIITNKQFNVIFTFITVNCTLLAVLGFMCLSMKLSMKRWSGLNNSLISFQSIRSKVNIA